MKKCILIYNPVCGKKDFQHKIDYVVSRMQQEGFEVDVEPTKHTKHAISIARDACHKQYDLMIISGGDGTFHECINGIAEMPNKPKIGYIPSGTACDLANTLRIPKNIDKALDIILNGVTVKMDVVKSNIGYFIYVAAIGTYVDISYITDSKLKKRLGYLAYLITGVKEFFTIPMIKTKIEHDNGTHDGYYSLIMIVNSKRVAGFNIIEKPQLDDGKVDVVLYKYIPFFNNILYFISFVITPKVIPGVKKFRTTHLNVISNHNHKWNMDGEEAIRGSLTVDVQKQLIEVIVKPEIKKKYFKENE